MKLPQSLVRSVVALSLSSMVLTACGGTAQTVNAPQFAPQRNAAPQYLAQQRHAQNMQQRHPQHARPIQGYNAPQRATLAPQRPTQNLQRFSRGVSAQPITPGAGQPPVVRMPAPTENFETGHILAGLKSADALSQAKQIAAKHNLSIERFITGINAVVFNTNGQDITAMMETLAQEKIFTYIETNGVARSRIEDEKEVKKSNFFGLLSESAFNDPHYDDQYALQILGAEQAWELSTGEGITISVIDSGVEIDHADLKNRVVPGYDALSDSDEEDAGDVSRLNHFISSYKHGTHVAGIIAAEANNKKGIVGIAPDAKIMPVKIFPDLADFFSTSREESDDAQITTSAIMSDAIVWSVDHGADVINMSLIMNFESETVTRAINYALDNNVAVVVSAGNQRQIDNARNTLAAVEGVIAVGATNSNNEITSYSNSGDYLTVVAPGHNVISSIPALLSSGSTRLMSGTSMAAPYVAGIAALLKAHHGATATPAWIKSRLEATSQDLGDNGWDELYGHGLVNAHRALVGQSAE